MLGLDHNGFPVETVLDVAEQKGFRTGVISEASISHATPAAFYGHSISRGNESLIAQQLVEDNDIEVLLGGGAGFFIPEGTEMAEYPEFATMNKDLYGSSWRKDDRNLIKEMKEKLLKIF